MEKKTVIIVGSGDEVRKLIWRDRQSVSVDLEKTEDTEKIEETEPQYQNRAYRRRLKLGRR